MDNEILTQLVQIKWLLVALVVVALLRVGLRTWWEVKASSGFAAMLSGGREFPERAPTLLDQGQHSELLALAQNRIEHFPGDALAFWYHATAAYRLGNHAEALASIKRVRNLQPDWVTTHVRPFIDEIDSQGLTPKRTADFYVVQPSVPASHDVPPTPIK